MKRLGLALLLCLTVACGGSTSPTAPSSPSTPTPAAPAPAPTSATLTGQVRNSLQQPVPGATVTANGISVNTGGDGRYSIPNLPLGALSLRVTAPGYEDATGATNLGPAGGSFDWVINFPLFSRSGVGDTVFDLPAQVQRIRIQATYSGFCQNFSVRISGSLLVNEILGTCSVGLGPRFDGTFVVPNGSRVVETRISSGVSWTMTESR